MMLSVNCCDFYDDMVNKKTIPPEGSINYLGVFNEYAEPHKKEDKILSLKTSLAYASDNLDEKNDLNSNETFFIGCQLTSKFDGIGNRSMPLDLVIILDVSGSMSSNLEGENSSCI